MVWKVYENGDISSITLITRTLETDTLTNKETLDKKHIQATESLNYILRNMV